MRRPRSARADTGLFPLCDPVAFDAATSRVRVTRLDGLAWAADGFAVGQWVQVAGGAGTRQVVGFENATCPPPAAGQTALPNCGQGSVLVLSGAAVPTGTFPSLRVHVAEPLRESASGPMTVGVVPVPDSQPPRNTITRSAGSFVADGFEVGQQVWVAGLGGSWTVVAVTPTVLTVEGASLSLTLASINAAGAPLSLTVFGFDPRRDGGARAGGDTITVCDPTNPVPCGPVLAGPASPLVVFGDTSQDGVWYSGHSYDVLGHEFGGKPFDPFLHLRDGENEDDEFTFPLADPFALAGNDVIDARHLFAGIVCDATCSNLPSVGFTAYGGAGNDVIVGSQAGDHLAGGSGDDVIAGGRGIDLIYGDSGVNLDILTRGMTVAVANESPRPTLANGVVRYDAGPTIPPAAAPSADPLLVAGGDVLYGEGVGTVPGGAGAFDDVILGDHGTVTQRVIDPTQPDARLQRIQTTHQILRIETRRPDKGGDDLIVGGLGIDRILGGNGGDDIAGNEERDVILGDHGSLDFTLVADDWSDVVAITTNTPTGGGADHITGDGGNDIVFGGTGADVVAGNAGNDLVFGDHGRVTGDIDAALLPLNLAAHPFAWTSIDTSNAHLGAGDLLRGNDGEDVILGGQGSDRITAGAGDDDVIGGHNVAGGHDGGDYVDAGAEDDVVAGDNASLLRTGTTVGPRMRVLAGDTVFADGGDPLVTTSPQADPRGATVRRVVLFDHSSTPAAGTWGNDVIAGGAEDDVLFGQLGNDWIQGDGSTIDDRGAVTIDVVATRQSVENLAGPSRDGDDYVEGGGGDDTIFGNLGQDDLVGGSSSLFNLTTPDLRPDGADTVFGGAGRPATDLERNDFGDVTDGGHARDADTILGDNGNIWRLVGTNGVARVLAGGPAFLTFRYDDYPGSLRIVPRAYAFLDYVQGGGPNDLGTDDLLHGEDGDDTVHGMTGNDVLFGEGQDDDLYGGTGFDRIYGGTGQDGILGDDGKVLTSRNGLAEPLNRLFTPYPVDEVIEIRGRPFTQTTINVAGELRKEVDLAAYATGWNDILYGGLGNDFLHGGAGDDAMSGAEATFEFYDEGRQLDPDPLEYDDTTTKFPSYDADNPREKIPGFLLNFDAYVMDDGTGLPIVVNGELLKSADGGDRLFGDLGNDWIVGGTDCDVLFGGFGDDLLNLDDNHETNGKLNDRPEDDVRFRDGDFAFGGAGRDVMILNTGGDRAFDWTGEFNSFIVPFSPFGLPMVDRLFSPGARDFLRALGLGSGTDLTSPMAEPQDELALVEPEDGPLWQDQHGAPRDPQPGNVPGEALDTQGGPLNNCFVCHRDGDDFPVIVVEKAVNAVDPLRPTPQEDADATGPVLAAGTPVVWTYLVANPGNVALTVDRLVDDHGTPDNTSDDFSPRYLSGDDNRNGLLDPGETWLYTSAGVVSYTVGTGTYVNLARVRGSAGGIAVTDDDPAVINGTVTPSRIRIEKAVNAANPLAPTAAEDADSPTGPVLAVGAPVVFTYLVTNLGTTSLANVIVKDDNGTPGDTSDDFLPTRLTVDANGLLDPGEVWLYRSTPTTAISGQYVNVGSVSATDATGATHRDDDPAHYRGTSGIRVEKAVNAADPLAPTAAEDADAAPGRTFPIGTPLVWTYLVTNETASPLANVVVRDDNGTPANAGDDKPATYVSGDTDGDGLLDPGETWLFRLVGGTVVAGPYANVGTATAVDLGGSPVADTDPAHHVGVLTGIQVEKAVNAAVPLAPTAFEDADLPTGPYLVIGSTVTWTYLVTNPQGVGSLGNVVLVDDNGTTSTADDFRPTYVSGDDGDNVLEPGEVWLYRATGTVKAGQYRNVARVTAQEVGSGATAGDDDPAHHFGTPMGVDIEKAVNAVDPARPTVAEDADDPRTPAVVAVGSPVVWTYLVSNTTNGALRVVRVTDDNGTPANPADDFSPAYVSGDNNNNQLLDRNEVWRYTSAGVVTRTAVAGPYVNVVVVEATPATGQGRFFDADPAYLIGATPAIAVDKKVNGQQGDTEPGVFIAPGTPVVWTYDVTNPGNVALAIVSIVDDHGTALDPGDDFSPVYVSGDADNDGLLDVGEVWRYTSTGVAPWSARPGQYTNLVRVNGRVPTTGQSVFDIDRSSHFGAVNQIVVEKAVNAADPLAPTVYEDADLPTGPILPVGSSVRWTYLVTNRGTTTLNVLGVIDDNGTATTADDFDAVPETSGGFTVGDTDRDGLLDPGETWLYRSATAGVVTAGQYRKRARVRAVVVGTTVEVTDDDPAHHFGTPVPGINVEKLVNGVDADSPSETLILDIGSAVTWTYEVTNSSTVPLTVSLTDDHGTPGAPGDDFSPAFVGGDTDGDGLLDPGEIWRYTSAGVAPYAARPGLYVNVVQVTGTTSSGAVVRDDDLSHHFGSAPAIDVEKAINALDPWHPTGLEDADTAPGSELVIGTNVVWTYLVTNTGNVALVDVVLVDDGGPGAPFVPRYVGGDTDRDGRLDVGETWLFTSQGVVSYKVVDGAYVNTASVTGEEPTTHVVVRDADVNHHRGQAGAEGNTPGFWKNNVGAWPAVYSPLILVGDVFDGVPSPDADETLLEALGTLATAGVDSLMAHAVAALLNATHPLVAYPLTPGEIVARVSAALATGDRTVIQALKDLLDGYNNLGSDLDAHGDVPIASIGDGAVNEGGAGQNTTVTLTITLDKDAEAATTLQWTTVDGTGVAGQDYVAASGTVTFSKGQRTAQVSVTVKGDGAYEADELFSVRLTNPVGLALGDDRADVTIRNDDAQPAVSVAATDNAGSEAGANTVAFEITRSANVAGALVVNLAWTGTATYGAAGDYTVSVTGGTLGAGGTTLTLDDGVSVARLTVTPVSDAAAESNETVTLTVAPGTGYVVGTPASASGTIADAASAPSITIEDRQVTEEDRNTTVVQVTLRLSASQSTPVTVTATTVAGTATAGGDFTQTSGTVTFAAGTTTATFSVAIVNDRRAESTETFTVTLSAASGATIADDTAVVTILDNDSAMTASAAGPGATGLEPGVVPAVLAEATGVWAAAGHDTSALAGVGVVVADLPGELLAVTDAGVVTLDADAAGWGWHTGPGPVPAGRMDLLTVLVHELGHLLGLDHDHQAMPAVLVPGTRELPAAAPVTTERRGDDRASAARVAASTAVSAVSARPALTAAPTTAARPAITAGAHVTPVRPAAAPRGVAHRALDRPVTADLQRVRSSTPSAAVTRVPWRGGGWHRPAPDAAATARPRCGGACGGPATPTTPGSPAWATLARRFLFAP